MYSLALAVFDSCNKAADISKTTGQVVELLELLEFLRESVVRLNRCP
jgi:hypothetical protein